MGSVQGQQKYCFGPFLIVYFGQPLQKQISNGADGGEVADTGATILCAGCWAGATQGQGPPSASAEISMTQSCREKTLVWK